MKVIELSTLRVIKLMTLEENQGAGWQSGPKQSTMPYPCQTCDGSGVQRDLILLRKTPCVCSTGNEREE